MPYEKKPFDPDRPRRPRPYEGARSGEGGGERPFKPRAFKPREEGAGGDRPFRKRPEGAGDRPYRARSETGGDRPFKKPFERRESGEGRGFAGKPAAGWRERPARAERDERPTLKRKASYADAARAEPAVAPAPAVSAAPAYDALAYRWRNQRLEPITNPQRLALEGLVGIELQKAALLQNTRQFVEGRPANHVLLTGARGTGKSSLVKALLTEFGGQGLRLVEVAPHDLTALPDIVAPLRGKPEKYILYVDDFSVANNDPALTALKTALDGGIEEAPANVLIYATSNRRHLMPELKSDNGEYHWIDDELHPGESTEEKISLSERFGLWLSFQAFNQDQYLDAVQLHLARLGVASITEQVRTEALRWALNRASRSGRVAQQFARDRVGRTS